MRYALSPFSFRSSLQFCAPDLGSTAFTNAKDTAERTHSANSCQGLQVRLDTRKILHSSLQAERGAALPAWLYLHRGLTGTEHADVMKNAAKYRQKADWLSGVLAANKDDNDQLLVPRE